MASLSKYHSRVTPFAKSLIGASILLSLLTIGVFAPVVRFDFVHWDDDAYVLDNPRVQAGVTADNVTWAFTTTYFGYYYPLTWLSHMLDCQLYGLWAGGHHATSVVIHLGNVLLLFVALATMTGAVWRSAVVAALFAVHPQHVESVAWIAERKDVLSTFFCLLAILAYTRFVARPTIARYLAVVVAFLLGLFAKPMIVTLPFILLLLDYWPLSRGRSRQSVPSSRLVAEKLPLVALLPLFGALTYMAQKKIHAVASVDAIPLAQRIANASISSAGYVVKMVAPIRLAAFYTHPRAHVSYALAFACAVALLLVTAAALRVGMRRRYVAVGWLWYVIALAPVIGLIQVGNQASADRYTYFPFVGLFLLIVWSAADALSWLLKRPRVPAAVLATVVVAAFAARARAQVFMWRNSETLFTTMVAVSPDAAVGHYNLGKVWDEAHRTDDAVASYNKAIELDPARADAWINLGIDLHAQGDKDAALKAFLRADALKPGVASTQFNLGVLYEQLKLWPEAAATLEQATRLKQDDAESWAYLALAYQNQQLFDKAVPAYRKAIALNSALVICRYNLGVLALKAGDVSGAREQLTALEGLDAKMASALHGLIQANVRAEHP